jgi:hypothetical protein
MICTVVPPIMCVSFSVIASIASGQRFQNIMLQPELEELELAESNRMWEEDLSMLESLEGKLNMDRGATEVSSSERTMINSTVRQITQQIIASTTFSKSANFEAPFNVLVVTSRPGEPFDLIFNKEKVVLDDETHPFHFLKDIKHPWPEGRYVYAGRIWQKDNLVQTKNRFDSNTRLVMEVYDVEQGGDGKFAVGHADSSVKMMEALPVVASRKNPFEILDEKGEL